MGLPYLCTTLLYWDAGLGDRFQIGRAIATALAPTKLSFKRLTVESYRAILYRVLQLDIEGVGKG